MRKLTSLFVLGTILLCACGGSKSRTATFKGLEFDSIVVDSMLALTGSENSPKCEIRLSIQYAKGENAEKMNALMLRSGVLSPDYLSLSNEKLTTKQSVDSFVSRFLSEYKQEYGELYRNDTEHAASYNCTYKVNTYTQNGADDVLNYIAEIYTYGGGAHSINQTIVRNFNVKTGKLIQLDDLFKPGYKPNLCELITKKCIKQFDVNDFDALKEKGVFRDGDVYVSENFILGDDDIVFIYCEDEIAPHSIGEIRIEIDKDELESQLK